ncbi:hypothetical protein [Flavobacterium sp. 9AF]|uniref:hypothetical protein n=1 Tax=Flavobacterium sp. 9AF TaxID=2653142 RepID=UPI001357036B|nr:hypothetical protein [Flavobacterium sp. 9AF]
MKAFLKILLFIFIISCQPKKDENIIEKSINKIEHDTNYVRIENNKKDTIINPSDSKVKIIVLQCSNGYGMNDFRKNIEIEISKNKEFEIIAFPNKKLLGVTFQGVYDKKYCQPIIDKLDVDYIIMTRFTGNVENSIEPFEEPVIWGYETKILNTKSMSQKISIRKRNLKEYQEIITDIKNNGETLIKDIENLK